MKKKHYILLGIVGLLVITNPSISAFKAYSGHSFGITRPINLFICCVYKGTGSTEYIGFLGNFIPINKPKPYDPNWNAPNPDSVFSDSGIVDTSKTQVVAHTSDGLPIFKKAN